MATNGLGKWFLDHRSQIFTAIGIGTMTTATIVAVKNTPKALEKIEEKKCELNKNRLSFWETVSATWKCYAIPFGLEVTGGGFMIAATSLSVREKMKLAAQCTMQEVGIQTLREFKERAKEELGEEKVKEIDKDINDEKIKRGEMPCTAFVQSSGTLYMFYDDELDLSFMSTPEQYQTVVNNLNSLMLSEMDNRVRVSDYIYALGLPPKKSVGNRYWDYNRGGLLEYTLHYETDDSNRPVAHVSFRESIEDSTYY